MVSTSLILIHLEKKMQINLDDAPVSVGGLGTDFIIDTDWQGPAFQIFKRGDQWNIMAMGRAQLKVNGKTLDLSPLSGGENLELNNQLLQIRQAQLEQPRMNLAHFLDAFRPVLLNENPGSLMEELVQLGAKVMDADHAQLYLSHPESVALRYPLGAEFPLSQTMVQRALQNREIVIWDAKENSEDYSRSIVRHNLSSIMVLPFEIDGKSESYLYVQRQDRDSAFSHEDQELFAALTRFLQALAQNSQRKVELSHQIEELKGVQHKGNLLFADASMAKVISQIERSARLGVPVFIHGETGTGKEVLARYLHDHSDRADKPFVAINCGAIPENLIESELFGHVKGAFTGALYDKKGLFAEAQGGTVFLDEIGELPLNVQVKLLRVLQEKKASPIGSHKEQDLDFRLVSATHVDLEKAVTQGAFREDLLYRINLMSVEIPPLRERGQDVLLLANTFLAKFAAEFGLSGIRLSKSAEKSLLRHSFSGNVRELLNRIQKALIQCDGDKIDPEDLGLSEEKIKPRRTLREAREEAERDAVQSALLESSGNLTLAGSILGIDRKVLRELMERLGMDKSQFKDQANQ